MSTLIAEYNSTLAHLQISAMQALARLMETETDRRELSRLAAIAFRGRSMRDPHAAPPPRAASSRTPRPQPQPAPEPKPAERQPLDALDEVTHLCELTEQLSAIGNPLSALPLDPQHTAPHQPASYTLKLMQAATANTPLQPRANAP